MENFIMILGYILTPITALVTYFLGRKKQRNDFLKDMQSSIDLLATKNKELLIEVIELRKENLQLRTELEELILKLTNARIITKKHNDESEILD